MTRAAATEVALTMPRTKSMLQWTQVRKTLHLHPHRVHSHPRRHSKGVSLDRRRYWFHLRPTARMITETNLARRLGVARSSSPMPVQYFLPIAVAVTAAVSTATAASTAR